MITEFNKHKEIIIKCLLLKDYLVYLKEDQYPLLYLGYPHGVYYYKKKKNLKTF